MSKKMIIFTIKGHSLWKELWKNLETIQSDGWDIKGLSIDTGKGKVTENIWDEFGEDFFIDKESDPFTAIRLSKDEVKVFWVMQQGGGINQGLQENTTTISIIVKKYAEDGDELFLLLHSTGGQVDENYKQISEGASIKIHPPREFIHDDTLIFKKIKKWVESNLKDGLDGLLNEVLEEIDSPDENKKLLRHRLINLRATFQIYVQEIKAHGDNCFSIMKDTVIRIGENRIEKEIEFYNKNIKGKLNHSDSICSEISETFKEINNCYKKIFSLFNKSNFVTNKKKIIDEVNIFIKLLNDIIDKLGGDKILNRESTSSHYVTKQTEELEKNTERHEILIIDDNREFSAALEASLKNNNFVVDSVENETQALYKIGSKTYHAILLDIYYDNKPKGKEIHDKIRKNNKSIPIIILSDEAAVVVNGKDYPGCKGFGKSGLLDITKFADSIRNIIKKPDVPIVWEIDTETSYVVGKTETMKNVYRLVKTFASQNGSTVLITGDSGTGKEAVAQAIHKLSARNEAPFVDIDCTAFTESLMSEELFGYEKGTFTGQKAEGKPGLLEVANQGTVFLDEIGEMPFDLQARLLRVLQERKFKRVGGTTDIEIDVRVIAATNKYLEDVVASGGFRKDLYYRLKVLQIELPPLRERIEDIEVLLEHFVKKHNMNLDNKISVKGKSGKFNISLLSRLKEYSWPGNIREFENAVKRAMALAIESENIILLPEYFTLSKEYIASKTDDNSIQKKESYYNDMVKDFIENELWHENKIKKDYSRDYKYDEFISLFNTLEKRKIISSGIINKLKELNKPYKNKDIAKYFWVNPSQRDLLKLRQIIKQKYAEIPLSDYVKQYFLQI